MPARDVFQTSDQRRRVSVVVPAYNAASTLRETLESARSQTYRNLEILIVDDGSCDGTAELVRAQEVADPRLRLIVQKNSGVAAARNRGIELATGEYVAFLDADDLWAPTKIEKQVMALELAGPRCALVYTMFARIDERGDVLNVGGGSQQGAVLEKLVLSNFISNGSSALVRRSALHVVGGFDTALREAGAQGCEDYKLYLTLAERYEFAAVAEPLTGYRLLPTSMSSDVLQMCRSYQRVLDDVVARHPHLKRIARKSSESYLRGVVSSTAFRSPILCARLLAQIARRRPWMAMRVALASISHWARRRRTFRLLLGLPPSLASAKPSERFVVGACIKS